MTYYIQGAPVPDEFEGVDVPVDASVMSIDEQMTSAARENAIAQIGDLEQQLRTTRYRLHIEHRQYAVEELTATETQLVSRLASARRELRTGVTGEEPAAQPRPEVNNYSAKETADAIGCSQRTLRRLIRREILPPAPEHVDSGHGGSPEARFSETYIRNARAILGKDETP